MITNSNLNKITNFSDTYDVSLLQGIPRILNRSLIGINGNILPFTGMDIWTLYELSWLNTYGLPQVAIGYVEFDSTSVNLIESKSLKLYLNSLNQTRFNSWNEVRFVIENDLSTCSQGKVTVILHRIEDLEGQSISRFYGTCIDEQNITIDSYQLNVNYLKDAAKGNIVEETIVSHLLKSNCPITHYPDWGSIQIQYRGLKINQEKLLRYLVSFRHHNEFNEQCVERIFNDIQYFCKPEKLSVYARYTRRGGLDINPWRTNNANFIPVTRRLVRQ